VDATVTEQREMLSLQIVDLTAVLYLKVLNRPTESFTTDFSSNTAKTLIRNEDGGKETL